jgi:microcystin-dependent protein
MDPFLGQIVLLPYDFTPVGWLPCEGQVLAIPVHLSLFNLLGARYGGDGVINFALPDLRGTEPHPGMHYCIAMSGAFPARPQP